MFVNISEILMWRNNNEISGIKAIAIGVLLFIFHLSPFALLRSQESDFRAVCQERAVLPVDIDAVMVVDGKLYCYAAGALLKATRVGETVTALLPDTALAALAPEATFLVRHHSCDLYLTQPDRKGRSTLMRLLKQEGRKPRLVQVRLEGMAVEHPTFTDDGRVMVFASRDNRTVGGSDLWYSLYNGQSWSKPVNLGGRINTKGDEFAPTIYREYLIFSSNGRDGRTGLYATRLISDHVTGDTVGMLQIGRSLVQHLPEPVDIVSCDDYDFAIDTMGGFGYWLSTRTGEPRLYSFNGALDGVVLWGYVKDKMGQRLQGVRISVGVGTSHPGFVTTTDSTGFYRVYLLGGRNYTVSYSLDDYFTLEENFTTPQGDIERLVTEVHRVTVMDRLPLDQRFYYFDIFGPNADTELSDRGRLQLQQLVRFLRDNPNLTATFSLACNLTDDASFNTLLTQQRIQSLQKHLYGLVPSSVKLRFTPGDASSLGSAAGVSRLTVVLSR